MHTSWHKHQACHPLLFKKLFPHLLKVGIIFSEKESGDLVKIIKESLISHGLQVYAKAVRDPKAAILMIQKLQKDVDAFWMVPDRIVITPQFVKALLLAYSAVAVDCACDVGTVISGRTAYRSMPILVASDGIPAPTRITSVRGRKNSRNS